MDYAADRQPWDQQPGEPALWFGRFIVYLKLKNRSINEAFRLGARKNTRRKKSAKVSKSQQRARGREAVASRRWLDMAREWKWEERAIIYDQNLRREQEKRTEQARADALAELTAQAKRAASRLGEVLNGKAEGDPSSVAQARLAANDILDRIGVPRTSRSQVEHSGEDGGTIKLDVSGLAQLTVEQLRALGEALRHDDDDPSAS